MKYIVSKSKQLICIMIVMSLFIVVCLSNFIEAFKMTNIPANGLTNNYFSFSTGKFRDKIIKNNIELTDMINFLKDKSLNFILLKESDAKIFGVYTNNINFQPNIISGRTFTKYDFQNKTNTILISEDLTNKCTLKNNKMFYKFDNNFFEVIGIFRPKHNTINKDAIAYYNLASNKLISKNIIYDNYVFGRFQLDAGKDTKKLIQLLNNYCTVEITRSDVDNTFSERLQKTLSCEKLTIFPFILIIFMIILNSISISSNWIENRKKEIYIRRLVGATNNKLSLMLVRDYILITTLSYVISLLLAAIILKLNLFSSFKFSCSIDTLIISYSITLLTGLISAILMLIVYYKDTITKIRG